MKTLVKYASIAAAFAPVLAFAQNQPPGDISGGTQGRITSLTGIWSIVQSAVNWLVAVFFLYATIQFLLAGWEYLSSKGDEAKVTEVRNRLLYGVIGVAVGLLAFSVPAIVRTFVGA